MHEDEKDKLPARDQHGDRQARLAEALRANLRKRKAQARARRKPADPPSQPDAQHE